MRTLYGVYVTANCVRLFTIHANGLLVSGGLRVHRRATSGPVNRWRSLLVARRTLLVEGGGADKMCASK